MTLPLRPPDGPALLTVRDVVHTYGRGESGLPRSADVNLQIRAGEFVCLLGPSGCGKSTFCAIISGLNRATAGDVLYRDERSSASIRMPPSCSRPSPFSLG